MSDEKKNRRKYEPPVSLHPLSPEDALRAFLEVSPEKVREREKIDEELRERRKAQKAKRPPKRG